MAKDIFTLKIEFPADTEFFAKVLKQPIAVDVRNMDNAGLAVLFEYGLQRLFNDRVNKYDHEDRPEAAQALITAFMEGRVAATRDGRSGGGMTNEQAIRKSVTRQFALNAIVAALKAGGDETATQKTARDKFGPEGVEKARLAVSADPRYADAIEAKVAERMIKAAQETDDDGALDLASLGLA